MILLSSLNSFLLIIVTCDHPFRDRESGDDESITIIVYMDPVTEGTTIIFQCPPQHMFVGPNTTTCMENGEWEPDPGEVECKSMYYDY